MKTAFIVLLLPLLLLFSSCGTGIYLASSYIDDAYYSPADHPVVVEKRIIAEPQRVPAVRENREVDTLEEMKPVEGEREYVLVDSLTEQLVDENGNVIINNHYYYEPEEDDWGYSNRIYRFNRPYSNMGYYNSLYWDDWGYGLYSPYSYYGMGYNSWYSPYGYYGMGYNSWYSPYGYYDWYNPYYYGSSYGWYNKGGAAFGNNSNYNYGHRNSWRTDGPWDSSSSMTKNQLAAARSVGSPRSNSGGQKSLSTSAVAQSKVIAQNKNTARTSSVRSGGISTNTSSKIANTDRTSRSRATSNSNYMLSRVGSSYARPPVRTSRVRSSTTTPKSTYSRPSISASKSRSSYSRTLPNSKNSTSGYRSSSNSYTGRSSSYRSASRNYRSSGSSVRSGSSVSRRSGSSVRSSSSGSRSSGSISHSSGSSSRSSGSGSSGSRSSSSGSRGGGRR